MGEPLAAARLKEEDAELLKCARNAVATIKAIYEWLDRVEAAGGATSIEGVAVCHAFLKSLRNNATRTNLLVIKPLIDALNKRDLRTVRDAVDAYNATEGSGS